MSIHFFEIHSLLISWEFGTKERKEEELYCEIYHVKCNAVGGILDHMAYRVLLSSFKSFSESSKKRVATSRTNSGLLSSCSCCSCVNWLSRNPFSISKQIQRQIQQRWKDKERKCNKISVPHGRELICSRYTLFASCPSPCCLLLSLTRRIMWKKLQKASKAACKP